MYPAAEMHYSTRMKSFVFTLGLLLLIQGFAAERLSPPNMYEHPTLKGGSAIHWHQFSWGLKDAKRVVVYYGTPRKWGKTTKLAEATVEIDDFEFYAKSVTLSPDLAEKVTALVLNPLSFSEYRGLKLCGGFHPDFCIEWQFEEEGQRWHSRAFACLGCDEWRLIDSSSAVHTDMPKETADELLRLIPKR